ncbi:hypothetical protein TNCT_319721 [Trichonephila clavata]|uniref:Uncharacterized protein n=1 Tax=Trichonephila clavata TaxID=2740835 RepID=A0A8X6GTC5_TRICU|nr:hypothetical protein TNCT_319721 [Trichonephila clavata]
MGRWEHSKSIQKGCTADVSNDILNFRNLITIFRHVIIICIEAKPLLFFIPFPLTSFKSHKRSSWLHRNRRKLQDILLQILQQFLDDSEETCKRSDEARTGIRIKNSNIDSKKRSPSGGTGQWSYIPHSLSPSGPSTLTILLKVILPEVTTPSPNHYLHERTYTYTHFETNLHRDKKSVT